MLKRIKEQLTASENSIELPKELEKNTLVLYRETEDKYTFVGLYNPNISDEEYADNITAFPLRSVYVRNVFLKNNTSVWNVLGTSKDILKNPDYPDEDETWEIFRNWINAWETLTEQERGCYVAGQISSCNDRFVGGHMQLYDPQGKEMPDGQLVYIIPICSRHNHVSVTGELKVSGNYKYNDEIGTLALEIEYEKPKKR